MKIAKSESSYKDPSGFIFFKNGEVYRQINKSYRENYNLLISSGLYKELTDKNLLIPHKEIRLPFTDVNGYKIIKPTPIPFISYPYEWCFSELKDAALLTLKVQNIALKYGMSLKDATGFNVQFLKGKPIFIDTLSFEKYKEGAPWIGYRQFCEQFLSPLVLMAYRDFRVGNKLLLSGVGKIPLKIASELLPLKARLNIPITIHIVAHAASESKLNNLAESKNQTLKFNRNSMIELIENLTNLIHNLKQKPPNSIWKSYYNLGGNNYSDKSFAAKKQYVKKFLSRLKPQLVWDMGANDGTFSKISAGLKISTVSFDNDEAVVEKNYLDVKSARETNILPLIIDIINPTPSLGWDNKERDSFFTRPHPDAILALALVHHLAIANNIPLSSIAKTMSGNCRWLIIEFVPKEDSQVKILLRNREDIFPEYNKKSFESEFGRYFKIKESVNLPNSVRTLYLMEKAE